MADREFPGIPQKHVPRPTAKTLRHAPAPAAPGSAPAPDLDATLEEGRPPYERNLSPPPQNEAVVPSSELGQEVAKRADVQDAFETERQLRHEAEAEARRLRVELRSARSENASTRHVEPAPTVEPAPLPDPDRTLGRNVRQIATYLLSLLLASGGGAAASVAARPTANPERVEIVKTTSDESLRRVAKLEERVEDVERYLRADDEADNCRLSQVGDAAWRLGYRTDWATTEIAWMSERLARGEKSAFRADKDCPLVPKPP